MTTEDKIRSFVYLLGGLDASINEDVVNGALRFLDRFFELGFKETDAFVGDYGEVMVTAYRDEGYIEVIAEMDGTFEVALENGGGFDAREENLSETEAMAAVKKFAGSMA